MKGPGYASRTFSIFTGIPVKYNIVPNKTYSVLALIVTCEPIHAEDIYLIPYHVEFCMICSLSYVLTIVALELAPFTKRSFFVNTKN